MGLEPVGYVQGFCVMQWRWYGVNSPYPAEVSRRTAVARAGTWKVGSARTGSSRLSTGVWGQNYEQSWVEDAWARASAPL